MNTRTPPPLNISNLVITNTGKESTLGSTLTPKIKSKGYLFLNKSLKTTFRSPRITISIFPNHLKKKKKNLPHH